ncbi:hypothetical protein Bp8pC_209 [Bacillus phage Bp8p-C]|uniref:Polymer-forming cytoskeletal protein n=2 Tax=Agatevirus Bp8pC TaxID=1910937 RepID=A0A0A0PQW0_9CAUD|nr:hypothetical protein AXJ20_gp139 [Bacillus phage Bp8p-C]YP_009784509.1 hypothetical protein QLX39_gp139 [Bacillus phage Bp8p-T]AHJ87639.1 hypothetical protein Bp8pC_209 [Bacillus phage Bp8p-C]AHJ87850.1 hypothetical protein Bp8pT_209 [Bacillus phage Bp8p-T]
MDFEYLVTFIVYSVTVLVVHAVADTRYKELVKAEKISYSAAGRFALGESLLLFPAFLGAAHLGLLLANLTTVTATGFVVALLIFSISLAAGGFLTFTALRSAKEDNKKEELTMENTEQKKYVLLKDDTINVFGIIGRELYRIQAVRDFGDVSKGELGGYIECEDNLSHTGICWVKDNAKVFGHAQVTGDALVKGNARVFGEAVISENAYVAKEAIVKDQAVVTGYADVQGAAVVGGSANIGGYASVRGFAEVSGKAKLQGDSVVFGEAVVKEGAVLYNNAVVGGKARVRGNALIGDVKEVFTLYPIGSEDGVLTAYLSKYNGILCTRGCFSGSLKEFSQAVTETHRDVNPSVFEEYQLAIKLIEQKLSKLK